MDVSHLIDKLNDAQREVARLVHIGCMVATHQWRAVADGMPGLDRVHREFPSVGAELQLLATASPL